MAEAETLEEFVQDEQASLWQELSDAIDHAHNGRWSMQCGWVAQRIIRAARLVGPSDPGTIPWTLHAGGVYEALLRVASIEVPETSADEWVHLNNMMATHGGTREQLMPKYAGTRADLIEDREAAFIREAA